MYAVVCLLIVAVVWCWLLVVVVGVVSACCCLLFVVARCVFVVGCYLVVDVRCMRPRWLLLFVVCCS